MICLGQVNCPGIKVLAAGQNAWDAALAAKGPMPGKSMEVAYHV